MKHTILFLIAFFISYSLFSQSNDTEYMIFSSAYFDNQSYNFLQRICDETGGRLAGSENNKKAMKILIEELSKFGYKAKSEPFLMPGWFRGDDIVEITNPVKRKLKALAMGYVDSTANTTAEVVYVTNGFDEDYNNINVKDKIVLVNPKVPAGKETLLRSESLQIAANHGAKAIMYMNEKNGMLNLCSVTNFHGKPSPIPAFTLTYEESNWIKRLLEKSIPVVINYKVNSYCVKEIESSNIIVTIPGKTAKKIVVTAHFDSWDMGQGSIDNGQGSAVLFDIARILKKYANNNYYTIELVWVNAEELGLWGSKRYVDNHKDEVIAMINMDMPGSPTGINAMGFDEFLDIFKEFTNKINGFNFSAGVSSQPWTNSDHMYFMFNGIPSFTFNGYLDKDMYWYYHDAGDTFDKVNIKYLSDAAAIVSLLTYDLANNTTFKYPRYTPEQVKQLLIKHNLDKRLKKQGEWLFD